jgi:hypothetical protein
LETTPREIVGVVQQGPKTLAADCLVEAAWALHLDERFVEEHGLQDVTVPLQ